MAQQTQSAAESQESQTNIYPNPNQINLWNQLFGTAGGLANYLVNNNMNVNATVAAPTDLTNQYWQQASQNANAPSAAGTQNWMADVSGYMNKNMAPQQYNIAPANPFGPGGAPTVSAPGGVSGLASYYQYNPQQVSGPTVSAQQVSAPTGVVNPITGLPQVQAPALQNYQMQQPKDVQAMNLQNFQMQAAAPVSAQQITAPQSWTSPGTAAQYMSPYTQNVVNAQLAQAQVQNQQQINAIQGQAAQQGAFGGTREAVEEANQNLGYQQLASTLEAQGLQSAYQQGMGQFTTEQQMSQQQQQANQQAGLQAALSNQQAQQQANVQNLSSFLQTQGLGAQTGLQASLANQQTAFGTNQANLQANLQTQGLGAQLNMQGQLANQATGLQTALYNQQAQEFTAGQQMQASLANQQANLQAAQATAGYNMQGQLANQASGLQAGLAAQQMGQTGAEFNATQGLQAQMANQAAQMQYGLQTQQLGVQGQMANAQFGLGAYQLNNANLMNQAQIALNSGQFGLADYQANLSGQNALAQAAAGQQGYQQQIADTNYQNQMNQMMLPWQGLEAYAGMLAESPSWGQTQTSDTYKQGQTDVPTGINGAQIIGGVIQGAAGALAAGGAKGGLLSIADDGTARFGRGGIADYAGYYDDQKASQFRRRLYSALRTHHHNYPAARKSPQRFLDEALAPESTGLGNIAYA